MKQGPLTVAFLTLVLTLCAHAEPLQVHDLRTELQADATGVSATPRLSWKLLSTERAKRQSHYHILAASSPDKLTPEDADLWNSKPQKRALKHLIAWGGKDLKDGQVVHWKVKVTDTKGSVSPWSPASTFTVGGKKKLPTPARTSTFKSDSEALNSLYQESITQLSARLAESTEGGLSKLGSGAQVQRSARALLYHFDALPHLSEWIKQMDASRTKEGLFPIQPGSKKLASLSSEAGITVNHPLWWMGGDHNLVKARWTHFEKHMIARETADKTFKGSAWGSLKASEGIPAEFLDLCNLGFTTRLIRELALPAQQPLNVIRFQDYASRIQKSFEKQYLNADGNLKVPSQSAHILALRSAVLQPKNQKPIIAALLASLDKNGLQVGPIGAHFLPSVLSLTNHQDKAIDLLTAMNEEEKKAFVGHGVSEWLMSFLAGIDASTAGFGNIRIAPRIPSGDSLKWVESSYHSISGEIKVRWEKLEDGGLKVNFTSPAGSITRITLPCQKGQSITESGETLDKAIGIDQASRSDTTISLISQSGSYSILIK